MKVLGVLKKKKNRKLKKIGSHINNLLSIIKYKRTIILIGIDT